MKVQVLSSVKQCLDDIPTFVEGITFQNLNRLGH
jgi:hypothetical protein